MRLNGMRVVIKACTLLLGVLCCAVLCEGGLSHAAPLGLGCFDKSICSLKLVILNIFPCYVLRVLICSSTQARISRALSADTLSHRYVLTACGSTAAALKLTVPVTFPRY